MDDADFFDRNWKKLVGIALAVIVALSILLPMINFVDQGERKIVTRFGEISRVMEPGLNLKLPIIESAYEYSVRAQKFQGSEYSVASSDSLLIKARIAFVWRYDAANLDKAYTKYGRQSQFESEVLRQITEQFLKETTGTFQSSEIIPNREKVAELMLSKLRNVQDNYHVIFDSVAIEDLTLPQAYRQAILEKEKAEQAVERQELNLQQQKLKAQEIVQTANAEAEAIRIKAEAQANANTVISQSLTELLVRQNEIERWDGALPKTLMGGDGQVGLFLQQK